MKSAVSRDESPYFAYGSNLSTTQMRERCPSSTPVGLARLPGWEWLINSRGYANIVKPQHLLHNHAPVVYGILYRLHREDEGMLDSFEGVPWAYQKLTMDVEALEGSDTTVDTKAQPKAKAEIFEPLVYIDRNNITPATTKPEYVLRMDRGIDEAEREWHLPRWYVDAVMRKPGYILATTNLTNARNTS